MPKEFRSSHSWSLRLALALIVALGLGTIVGSGGGGGTDDPQQPPSPPAYTGPGLQLDIASVDGASVAVWPGESTIRQVILSKAVDTIRTQLSLETSSPAVRLEAAGESTSLVVDASSLAAGFQLQATIIAANLDNGESVRLPVNISVLSPQVVAAGNLLPGGSAVSSPGGAIGVQIAPGQLSAPLGVVIRTASMSNGRMKMRMQFDRDISNEAGTVTLISNRAAVLPLSEGGRSVVAATDRRGPHALFTGDYPIAELLEQYPAVFVDPCAWPTAFDQNRLASLSNVLSNLSRICKGDKVSLEIDPNAAQLVGVQTAAQLLRTKATNSNLAPVLFIHGFNLFSAPGGGESTWNTFPQLVANLNGPTKYLPFEFRWRTGASFGVVANDLANAIRLIYNTTGKPVRVVSHSFGGLLIRTLLQGLASTETSFDPAYVHSVLTLGTPHSGIFEEPQMVAGLSFPRGQDSVLFKPCAQVSCYQAGATVAQLLEGNPMSSLTMAGNRGGLMAMLASGSSPAKPLPPGLPFVVGIGLKRNVDPFAKYQGGDGLIGFDGQRFSPASAEAGSTAALVPLDDCSAGSGQVKETVLGATDANGNLDSAVRPGSPVRANAKGYSHIHSAVNPDFFRAAQFKDLEFGEPYVECPSIEGCDHASWKLFKATLDSPRTYCDGRTIVPSPTTSTLMGSNVTLTIDLPNLGTHITVPNKQRIRDEVEFVSGSLQRVGTFANPVGVDINLGTDSIELSYTQSSPFATGAFNGYVFEFEPTSPKIIGAALDPASTFGASQVPVTFSDHQVTINVAGLAATTNSRILLRLTLAPASAP